MSQMTIQKNRELVCVGGGKEIVNEEKTRSLWSFIFEIRQEQDRRTAALG